MKTTENSEKTSLKTMAAIGAVLMMLGLVFAIIETSYFGSSYLPESKAEFVCDYIATLLCGGGGSLFIYAITSKTIKQIKGLLAQLKELKGK